MAWSTGIRRSSSRRAITTSASASTSPRSSSSPLPMISRSNPRVLASYIPARTKRMNTSMSDSRDAGSMEARKPRMLVRRSASARAAGSGR